jgi:hypothetical protein
MVLAVKNNEFRLHGNKAAFKMLENWFKWLSDCPEEENWELHFAWMLNANQKDGGKQFSIITDATTLDGFFSSDSDGIEEELTAMTVDTEELDAILRSGTP